ncbi:hypothetical protein ZIOFF_031347 [Zingiber officinale]|uniref:Uncharacterized protein n=1 Tax=Zingiber officinale TaxID=94328 RepID=A0A8J5L9Y7_ZINOF|nr:hypothetical protein ZIOFF_031347 [Zingiber officinale]
MFRVLFSPSHLPLFLCPNFSSATDGSLPAARPHARCRCSSPHLPRFPKPLSAFPFCRRPSLSDRRSTPRTANAVGPNSSSFPNPQKQMQQQQQVRTLFPGGFQRPEISVPTLVLRLSVDESLERGAEIDFALPKGVGVVVLDCGACSEIIGRRQGLPSNCSPFVGTT